MAPALPRSIATASLNRFFPPKRKKAAAWGCGWPAELPTNTAAASGCAAAPPKDLPGHAWLCLCQQEELSPGQKNETVAALLRVQSCPRPAQLSDAAALCH